MKLTQRQMYELSRRRHANKCHAFNEIMTGPNPLTRGEIRRLIAKHSERYGFLEAWVKE